MHHMAQPYTLQHKISAFIYIYILIDWLIGSVSISHWDDDVRIAWNLEGLI